MLKLWPSESHPTPPPATPRVCRGLENMGIVMDYAVNKTVLNKLGSISHGFSNVALLVVPTNEELQIATDTYQLVFQGGLEIVDGCKD